MWNGDGDEINPKMPTDYSAFINVIAELCDERNIRCCVSGSVKGGLLAGCSALIGGVLLGPIGLAVGSVVGGVAAAASSKGKFQPLSTIIRGLPPHKKEQLFRKIAVAINAIDAQDVIALSALLLANRSIADCAIKEVKNYLAKESNIRF